MRKVFLAFIGVILALAGLVGLVLPILPGWPLIFVGLSLIAPRFAERLKRRVFRVFSKNELLHFKKWHKAGVEAGFTTKRFPVFLSKTDDLLDAGKRTELLKALSESKVALKHGMKPVSSFVVMNQVHGNHVVALEDATLIKDGFCHLKETDGVITNIRGAALIVLTADCLPVFLKAPGWVGLVHAGWRGTKDRIVKKAYDLLKLKSRCKDSEIKIIFGPYISADHYEVGPEFRDLFSRKSLREKKGKLFFDLAGENKRQLLRVGAKERNIAELYLYTVEDNEDYYSFRKEKDAAGRMVSFIVMQDYFSSGRVVKK